MILTHNCLLPHLNKVLKKSIIASVKIKVFLGKLPAVALLGGCKEGPEGTVDGRWGGELLPPLLVFDSFVGFVGNLINQHFI